MIFEALNPANHEIRVLLLLPDRDIDATIRCQLVQASLDDEHLQYEALSYVWGNAEPAQDIEVDGAARQMEQLQRICNDKLLANSWQALYHLIRENQYWRRIWITQEVVLSDRLTFYVGVGSCTWEQLCGVMSLKKLPFAQLSNLSTSLLWSNLDDFESLTALYCYHRETRNISLFESLVNTVGRSATNDHDCVYGLLGLVHAPDLVPDYEIPLNTLCRNVLCHIIEHERSLDILSFCTLGSTLSDFELRERRHTWYMCVPNDRTQELRQRNILIDRYFRWTGATSNAPLMEYDRVEVIRSWIPSWIPYWPVGRSVGYPHFFRGDYKTMFYCATGNSQPQVRFEGDILVVHGIKISRIVSIPKQQAGNSYKTGMDIHWTSYCSYEDDQKCSNPNCTPRQKIWTYPYGGTPQGNLRAFQTTVVLGRDEYGRKDNTIGDFYWNRYFTDHLSPPKESGQWIDLLPDCRRDIQQHEELKVFEGIDRIDNRSLFERVHLNNLFFTSSGHMGIGPPGMRDGDIICLLLGARLPFVLRPYENPSDSKSEQHFYLLGECCK